MEKYLCIYLWKKRAKHVVRTKKFLLEGLECYKDTQMKACGITKVTAATMYGATIKYLSLYFLFVGVPARNT